MDEYEGTNTNVWEMLLSRKPMLISKTYESLEPGERKAVLDHLKRMVSEPGWQSEQRDSALAALDVISDHLGSLS